MAGKSRFKIPTGEEMERSAPESPSMNSMSLFQNYRQQKKDTSNMEQNSSKAGASNTALKQSNTSGSLNSHILSKLGNVHPNQMKSGTNRNTIQKSGTVSNGVVGKLTSLSGTTSSLSETKSAVGDRVNAAASSASKSFSSKSVSAQSTTAGPRSTAENAAAQDSESSAGSSKAPSVNSIIVNFRQRGNPILKHVRNVPWEYGSIIPDYVMGKANCALFLSLRYHQLNPTYIHNRLKELGKGYDLRVILVQVDVTDPHHLLKDLAKICILADCTLMVAFSVEEAGRYLETYKVYENKPAEALMEKIDTDYISKLTDTLTTVKSVNKTDCMTLLSTFGSFEEVVKATREDLSLCPGFGPQKAQRLYDVLHEPFVKGRKRKKEDNAAKDSSPSTSTQHSPVKKPS